MNIDLRLGDCFEVMKKIEDNSIDAIITDPPYGTTACKWDSVIDFNLMWEQLNRIIKPNGAIVLFGSEPFSSALRMSNIKNYKYDWKWDKIVPTNFLNAKKQPMRIFEDILVFNCKVYYPIMIKRDKPIKGYATKSSTNNDIKLDKTTRIYTHKYPTNKIELKRIKGGIHPTQKPIELMEYLIKTYTQENQTVLDFTMGSGSTMVACVSTNRNGIGIEMDENYFNIAKKRVDKKKEEKDNEPPTLFNAQT
jgi:site-specific DNA-methyltransferase (adenine-specific)